MLLALAGLWVRSGWYVDGVTYRYGREWPPVNAVADPRVSLDGCWRYEAGSLRLLSHDSAVQLVFTGYTSYAPDRSMHGLWQSWPGWATLSLVATPRPDAGVWLYYRGLLDWRLWRLGVTMQQRQGETARVVSVPYGLLMVVTALPAFVAWRRGRMRAARRRAGRCAGCGYDCRGLERCPECGRAVAAG